MASANDNRPLRAYQSSALPEVRLRWAGAGLCLVALTACTGESPAKATPPAELQVWVGEVASSDVAVGIVASAERSTLFFCGGNSSYADHTHWFVGAGPLAEATQIEDGPWQVSISSFSERLLGTLVVAGSEPAAFSAEKVALGMLAGVYDAVAPCGHAGLIVRQPTASGPPTFQGTCLDSQSGATVVEQVNPVMPLMRGADSGISASLANDPSQQLTLHPLVLQGN